MYLVDANKSKVFLDKLAAVADWTVVDTDTNAAVTATKAGSSGESHYITSVTCSFAATNTLLLELKDATTTIWQMYVYDSAVVNFTKPLKITAGADAVLTVTPGVGETATVTLAGFTK